jgi:hypothetical protein
MEPHPSFGRIWGYWEGGVVYGGALYVGWCHGRLFTLAKEWAAGLRALPDDLVAGPTRAHDAEAWVSDALGWLVLTGDPMGWVAALAALFGVAVAWFLLPR